MTYHYDQHIQRFWYASITQVLTRPRIILSIAFLLAKWDTFFPFDM